MKRPLVLTASFTLFPLLAITQLDASGHGARPAENLSAPGKSGRMVVRDYQFIADSEIAALPACNGKIVAKSPCSIFMETTDGKRFSIGSPGATRAVAVFINTLRVGETYRFPDAWREYLKKQPKG